MTAIAIRKRTFHRQVVQAVLDEQIPFMLGGAYALRAHTGVHRDTKDIDIFCTPGDFSHIMEALSRRGFRTKVIDHRWLGKAYPHDGGEDYADLIFGSVNGISPVTREWIERAHQAQFFRLDLLVLAPEELIYSKAYVQDRDRYDGADINHTILRVGKDLDWRRLLHHMDQHWELLLCLVMNFLFVYPSRRYIVPRWLLEELLRRTEAAAAMSYRREKICRGPLLSRSQYEIDVEQWGFRTIT